MKKVKIFAFALSAMFLSSCDSDDDGIQITDPTTEEPTTYTFERDGESTVSFGGQTTRILMVNEIASAMTDFEGGTTEDQLLSMYAHEAGNADFSDNDLNESGKNVRSKVAASSDYFSTNSVSSEEIKQNFANLLSNQATQVIPNYTREAEAGVAGVVVIGDRSRFVNEFGMENNQLLMKGLIGALMADQALNNYLSPNVLDAGSNVSNNNNGVTEEGKSYTTMEHKWDEAYGYIYGGNVENAAAPNESESAHNSYLHKYIQRVDSNENFAGISEDIFNAFKKGRFAIVSQDYTLRNEQANIIKENISKVIAVRAIHYLQAGKNEIEAGTRTSGFHDLSEGLGFLYSLQFTHNPNTNEPYLSSEEVTELLASVYAGNGLWTVSTETLQSISETIASKFDFTVEQAM